MQSLIGSLNFACRAIIPGRPFCRRLIIGVSVFHERFWVTNEDVQLYTDSAGGCGLGFGAFFAGKWAAAPWPQSWIDLGVTEDITVLEMFPLLVCIHIWGPELRNNKNGFSV